MCYVPAPAGMDYHQLAPLISDGDIGCYSRPTTGNHILIGSEDPPCDTLEWVDDPDDYNTGFTHQWETQVMREAQRLDGLGIPGQTGGLVDLYDVSDDWIPIYDKSDLPGFYMAVGTSGNQFKNAPVAGRLMAELIDQVEAGTRPRRRPRPHPAPLHPPHVRRRLLQPPPLAQPGLVVLGDRVSRAVGDRGAKAFSAQTRLLWDACPGPEDLRLALRKAVLQPVRGIPGLAGDGGRTASRAGRPFGSSRGFAERAAAIGGGVFNPAGPRDVTMPARRCAVAAALAYALGCGGGAPPVPSDVSATWTTLPEYEIGSLHGERGSFERISAIGVSDDGTRIHVVDSSARGVSVWAPDGSPIFSVGGEGDGPGEFRGPPKRDPSET